MKRNPSIELDRRRVRQGYTLVELLTVLAIVALLFAVVLPVFASAKTKAKTTRDISDLHQLGIAGAMYHDSEGRWPQSTPPLVQAGLVPKAIVASIRDDSVLGQTNDFAIGYPKEYPVLRQGPTPYRRTYFGPWDYATPYDKFQKNIEGQPAAGWLVDVVGLDAHYPSPLRSRPEKGSYLRVMFDGTVVSRPYLWMRKPTGQEAYSSDMLYADGDQKWLESLVP